MNVAMLGSGFIARFYAESLQAQRAKDQLISVYSRNGEKAKKFAEDYQMPW
jgi:predicted dehydrogenase